MVSVFSAHKISDIVVCTFHVTIIILILGFQDVWYRWVASIKSVIVMKSIFFTTLRAEVKIGLLQQNDIFCPPGGYVVPFWGGGQIKGMWKPPSQRDFNQSNFLFVLIYAPACIIPSSMVDVVPYGHLLQKTYNYVVMMMKKCVVFIVYLGTEQIKIWSHHIFSH